MEIVNITTLYTYLIMIEVVIQIIILHNFKQDHKNKTWSVFSGLTFTALILNIVVFAILITNSNDLNDVTLSILVGAFVLFFNIIIIIAGLIIKRKNNKKIDKKGLDKKAFIKTSLIVIVINLLAILIPLLGQTIIYKVGETYINKYLTQKYGESDYQVVKVEKDYSYNGIVDKFVSAYNYEMKSNYTKGSFVIKVDDNTFEIKSDYFLPVYYSEQNNLDYEIYIKDDILHTDFDALVDYINSKLNKNLSYYTIINGCKDFSKSLGNNKKVPSLEQYIQYLNQNN